MLLRAENDKLRPIGISNYQNWITILWMIKQAISLYQVMHSIPIMIRNCKILQKYTPQ